VAPLAGELPGLNAVIRTDDARYRGLLEGDAPEMAAVNPSDPAWLFYTSGTTGRPKGATLTHRNLLVMTLSYFADIDRIGPEDTIIHPAPLSHGSGCYSLPHIAKGANNVIPESGHFDPPEIFDLISQYPGVSFFAAPTMITRLVHSREIQSADTANLKSIIYGGGPMYVADLRRALNAFGFKLVQIFGQGEAPMTITALSKAHHAESSHPRYDARLSSTGIARTDVEVRVIDENDNALPSGEVGEVAVRGDVVMAGYWKNPGATADTLRGGWLHTGDIGFMDEEGFLTLKDRLKDMIISGGTNIYPREVEEVLLKHDAVLEASVVGRPHPDWGEEVVAFLVPRDNVKLPEGELNRLCLEHIARFKRPKAYYFLDALPKNNYGKILKTDLRGRLIEQMKEK
jgi:long-chain acyl-CoA synthetase